MALFWGISGNNILRIKKERQEYVTSPPPPPPLSSSTEKKLLSNVGVRRVKAHDCRPKS